jgi:precorrin-6B C5,15-methyltransferase / cobalt-precorrin-6B C5,C15-methyltransferase
VDRVRGVCELLTGLGYQAGGTQLQASRLAGLPGGSLRLDAANPVFVVWADRPAPAGAGTAGGRPTGTGTGP